MRHAYALFFYCVQETEINIVTDSKPMALILGVEVTLSNNVVGGVSSCLSHVLKQWFPTRLEARIIFVNILPQRTTT